VIALSIKSKLEAFKDIIPKTTLIDIIKQETDYDKDSSLRWVIYRLVKDGLITKLDSKNYFKGHLKKYKPSYDSETKLGIEKLLNKAFPELTIVVYESTILNEWLNHQVGRNVTFVEVDRFYTQNVFREIKQAIQKTVLLNPSIDDYYTYAEDDMVVIGNLITQAPRSNNSYDIRLEKLIVDIFSSDLISEFISQSEYEDLLESLFKQYLINTKTLLAYAKRRNLVQEVHKHIEKYIPEGNKKND
jgi:hypothetical protein